MQIVESDHFHSDSESLAGFSQFFGNAAATKMPNQSGPPRPDDTQSQLNEFPYFPNHELEQK
ncbi:hypothetical protein [Cupriavidus taiwanensis]|uniref:hypothetical protein n=1 Tax=Cupriavidus taiwanensis TaxID=164546 RepID=UPI0039C20201